MCKLHGTYLTNKFHCKNILGLIIFFKLVLSSSHFLWLSTELTGLFFSVPPHQLLIYDNSGRDVQKTVGPLEEGSDLILTCEVRGGKCSLKLISPVRKTEHPGAVLLSHKRHIIKFFCGASYVVSASVSLYSPRLNTLYLLYGRWLSLLNSWNCTRE